MNTANSDFINSDEFSSQYDDAAKRYGWHAPEVLFGLMYDRIEPDERLLDLGIGTGLSAVPFSKAGLLVYGIDGSQPMLDRAAKRGGVVELTQHDIRTASLPFPDQQFDHVLACGVFHLIGRLDGVFSEANRLIREAGTFAFTTEELAPDAMRDDDCTENGVLKITNEPSGVVSYKQSDTLIRTLVQDHGFETSKTLDFVAYGKTEWSDERTFKAYVAIKRKME